MYCLIIKFPTAEPEQAETERNAVVRGGVEMSLRTGRPSPGSILADILPPPFPLSWVFLASLVCTSRIHSFSLGTTQAPVHAKSTALPLNHNPALDFLRQGLDM